MFFRKQLNVFSFLFLQKKSTFIPWIVRNKQWKDNASYYLPNGIRKAGFN
jgi:hypothetical protein